VLELDERGEQVEVMRRAPERGAIVDDAARGVVVVGLDGDAAREVAPGLGERGGGASGEGVERAAGGGPCVTRVREARALVQRFIDERRRWKVGDEGSERAIGCGGIGVGERGLGVAIAIFGGGQLGGTRRARW
jgi:hypothetical protein